MKKTIEFYSEGSLIKGDLHFPDTLEEGKTYPAIVLCHGFAGVKEMLLPNYAKSFAKEGYITLNFDYRGFGESEGERFNLNKTNQIIDIRNAITYLQTLDEVDTEKIALWGTSYGGANAITAFRYLPFRCPNPSALYGINGIPSRRVTSDNAGS